MAGKRHSVKQNANGASNRSLPDAERSALDEPTAAGRGNFELDARIRLLYRHTADPK